MTEHQSSEEGAEGLTEAERDAICICPWTNVGVCPGDAHETRCSQHRARVLDLLADRLAAADEYGSALAASLARQRDEANRRTDSAEAENARLRARLAEVEALAEECDRLQTVVNQGAAGALCPDMRTHGERVHRIVAAAEAAEAERDDLRARLSAVERVAEEWKWYEAGDITADLRAALASPSSLAQRDAEVGARVCRYPCGCDQFPDEHCACMDGHADALAAEAGGES
jgi:hypothetical protein